MPHQALSEDDDPVIASYPVYLTPTNAPSSNLSSDILPSVGQQLFLLQYSAYRPADTPYNSSNLQKPTSLRIKPSIGLLELDVPIDTELNYNPQKGSAYATSLKRSRVAQEGGTHGLSGGFNTGPVGRNIHEDEDIDIKTIPAHSSLADESCLSLQTLGGKIVKPSPGDPIYLLGSFQNNSMHLSHLDALVQVRPQLPHLDAADELERARGIPAIVRAKGRDGAVNGDMPAPPAGQSARPESKAIDIKLKSSGPSSHNNDLSTNTNAKLLRAIQQEPWKTYDWIDEDETESHDRARKALHLSLPPADLETPILESAVTNSQWLDLMSAPRIEHGKKGGDQGLMGKVRGRERERQRRKRNEAARRERATTTTTAHDANAAANETGAGDHVGAEDAIKQAEGTAAEDTADGGRAGPSDEESSEDDDGLQEGNDDHGVGVRDHDVEMVDSPGLLPTVTGPAGGAEDEDVQEVQQDPEAAPPIRRRGRPRKSQPAENPIVVEDD